MFTNAFGESFQSNVLIRSPQNLPPDIKNMLSDYCYDYKNFVDDKLLQLIRDNNPDLQNLTRQSAADLAFASIFKKLVADSPEFKFLHGNKDSIVFDKKHTGPNLLDCIDFGMRGTFQTDLQEKYGISIGTNSEYTYSFTLYPYLGSLSSKDHTKYLVITEVELNSKNGTQWIRIYNPNTSDIPLRSVYINGSNQNIVTFDYGDILKSRHDMVVQLNRMQPNWSNINNTIHINSFYPDIYGNNLDDPSDSPTSWDQTPPLTDVSDDSRTWQYNGTGWMFTDKQVTIPEFPFAIPVFIISIASLIIFYRIKFR